MAALLARILAFALLFAACGPRESPRSGDGGYECDEAGDDDGDCVSNADEGCTSGRDTDEDGNLDADDRDADGDGINDDVEIAGQCASPPDHDGDGTPDYIDPDSDNDGVDDGDED